MGTSTNIALMDWDGSLRHGFHVRDFLSHYRNHSRSALTIYQRAEGLFAKYFSGDATYNELLHGATALIAKFAKGMNKIKFRRLCSEFAKIDKKLLPTYQLCESLTNILDEFYIISGSPTEIIEPYFQNISNIFILGTELEMHDLYYTGCVKQNNGGSDKKLQLVEKILRDGVFRRSLIGIGDTSSDKPLLEKSFIKLFVGDSEIRMNTEQDKSSFQIYDFDTFNSKGVSEIIKILSFST